MKKNCQMYTAQEAYDEIFHFKPKKGKIDNIHFTEDGCLKWLEGNEMKELNPCDVCYSFNMPLWEVVMVDNFGLDEYAILLYED